MAVRCSPGDVDANAAIGDSAADDDCMKIHELYCITFIIYINKLPLHKIFKFPFKMNELILMLKELSLVNSISNFSLMSKERRK